jgi:hypothetical protein
MFGKKDSLRTVGPAVTARKRSVELIATARGELEAGGGACTAAAAPLSDIRIRIREVDDGLEMHISAKVRYGLPCAQVAAALRRRILARIGNDVRAVHFFVRGLLTNRS